MGRVSLRLRIAISSLLVFAGIGLVTSYFVTSHRAMVLLLEIWSGALVFVWLVLLGAMKTASKIGRGQKDEEKSPSEKHESILRRVEENYLGAMRSLVAAVHARDNYTAHHSLRVSYICLTIGKRLGLPGDRMWNLQLAAALHDIGKISLPDAILLKEGELETSEWVQIKEHPSISAAIIMAVPNLKEVARIVRCHHEHFSGAGYPTGLRGDQIPIEARILSAADALDAMITDRPYRKALPFEEALSRLRQGRGTQFDPRAVDILLEICETDRSFLENTLLKLLETAA